MNWRLWTAKDLFGFAAVVVVVGALLAAFVLWPNIKTRRNGAGFGPEWDCTPQAKGDPICVKRSATSK